jgi:hypothetical protein
MIPPSREALRPEPPLCSASLPRVPRGLHSSLVSAEPDPAFDATTDDVRCAMCGIDGLDLSRIRYHPCAPPPSCAPPFGLQPRDTSKPILLIPASGKPSAHMPLPGEGWQNCKSPRSVSPHANQGCIVP